MFPPWLTKHGMHPSDGDVGRLAVKTPSSELAFLVTNAIPFGAVGGVCGLLRTSTALTLAASRGPSHGGRAFMTPSQFSQMHVR